MSGSFGSFGSGGLGGGIGASSGTGTTSVLREFLVKLGYAEDEQSRRKFGDAIKVMTTTIVGLGAAVAATAAGVVAGVKQMADGMSELHFVAQRTGSTVGDIRVLEGAFSGLGSTAGEARQAMEGLAKFVRENPAGKTYIESWTHQPYEGAAKGIEQLSIAFKRLLAEGMNPATLLKLGESFNLTSQQVLTMLQTDFNNIVEEYRKLDQKILGDRQNAMAVNALEFDRSYNLLLRTLNDFALSFGDAMNTRLKPQIDQFTEYLTTHQKAINDFLDKTAAVITKAMKVTLSVIIDIGKGISDLTEWYRKLTPQGKAAAEAIGAVAAAMWLLNTRLAASPLGILATLGTGLLLLYEDYKKWKEDPNTETFIDWNKWAPDMEAALKGIGQIADIINTVVTATVGWQNAAEALLIFMAGKWSAGMVAAVAKTMIGIDTAVKGSLLWKFVPLLALLGLTGPAGGPSSEQDANKDIKDLQSKQAGGSVLGNWMRRNMPMLAGRKPGELVNPLADQTMDDVQRNFLNTLAGPESEGDYRIKNGGSEFDSFEQFPDYVAPGGTSTASGRYQFTRDTWNEVAGILGLKDFSPANQDKAAWYLAQREYAEKSGGRALREDWQDPTRRTQIASGLYGRWPSTAQWANAAPTPIAPKAPPVTYDQLGRPMKPGQTENSPFFQPNTPAAPDNNTVPMSNVITPSVDLSRLSASNFTPSPAAQATAGNDNSVVLNQTNNITVQTGNSGIQADPNYVADLVAQRVQQNTAQIVRNGVANVR